MTVADPARAGRAIEHRPLVDAMEEGRAIVVLLPCLFSETGGGRAQVSRKVVLSGAAAAP